MAHSLKQFLKSREVLDLTKQKKSQMYADIAAGKFPAPCKRGRSSFWLADEIALWQEKLIAERDAAVRIKKSN